MGQVLRDFHLPGRSAVFASNGLCATSHPLAAATAIDILKAGGNAMDAAIGGAVLLGLCEPQMTGLGGDCFVLFNPPGSDDVKAMNGSGRAPAALDPDAIRALGHTVMPEGELSRSQFRVLLMPSAAFPKTGESSAWTASLHQRSSISKQAFRLRRAPPSTGSSHSNTSRDVRVISI